MNERDRKLRLVHSQPDAGQADAPPRPPADDLPDGEPQRQGLRPRHPHPAESAHLASLGEPQRQGLRPRHPHPAESAHLASLGEPPFTEEELREAERIRDAIETGDEPVSSSLRSAHRPSALAEADHEALLARALGDPLAAPTRVEQAAAVRLRAALGEEIGTETAATPVTGAGASAAEAASMVEMLRAAWRPAELLPLRNEALIARALSGAGKRRRRSEIASVVVGVLALAAGVALWMGGRDEGSPGPRAPGAGAPVALIPARSTMHLFDASTPFPRTGDETSRIDRITLSRTADLRANRYAQWGVR